MHSFGQLIITSGPDYVKVLTYFRDFQNFNFILTDIFEWLISESVSNLMTTQYCLSAHRSADDHSVVAVITWGNGKAI